MASYSYDYDFAYIPSAPVVEIEVSTELEQSTIALVAFIDTGADALKVYWAHSLHDLCLRQPTGRLGLLP